MKYFGYFLTNKRSIYSWGLVTFAFGMSYLSYFENFSKAILTLLASVHCGQWSPLSLEALLVMALIYVVWDRRDGGSGEPGFDLRRKDFTDSLKLFLLGYAVTILFMGVISFAIWKGLEITESLEPTRELDAVVGVMGGTSIPFVMFLLLINAIIEEGIIRGLFMNEMNRLFTPAFVVLSSAFLQAGYHIYQGWVRCLAAFFMFLVFAVYYQKHKRAAPIILAHFYVDGFGVALLHLVKFLGVKSHF